MAICITSKSNIAQHVILTHFKWQEVGIASNPVSPQYGDCATVWFRELFAIPALPPAPAQ